MEKINTADLYGFQLHIYQEVQPKLKMATSGNLYRLTVALMLKSASKDFI